MLALLAALLAATGVQATPSAAEAQAILMRGVGFDTVKGRGKVPSYAADLKAVLVAAGFSPADIAIEPVGETANLHLVWKGAGQKPPMAIAGHMDVVEANPKDWVRDPFTATIDGDYIFGRGVGDNKFDVSMVVATLAAMKRDGFVPGRDIHLFLSGDEETDGFTAALQAKQAKAAGVDFLLNTDGGGGGLDATGKPIGYALSAAEKTYADFQLVATSPGGHSSQPSFPNAIAQIAAAASRINAHHFAPQINDITRASLRAQGAARGGTLGKAMIAFADNPADAAAIAALRGNPGTSGQIATTCVPTMLSAGHAPNALPQKATLTVNCRIFPGTSVADVRGQLQTIVADPAVSVAISQEWVSTPASPLRSDVVGAVTRAVAAAYPGVTPMPSMDAGASDSVYYRALDIPSYGVSGLFMKNSDVFIHGLDERIPTGAIAPALRHWETLITDLAR